MLEKLIEFIAPDECLVCRLEGRCLCEGCAKSVLQPKKQSCVFCNTLNETGKTCPNCYRKHGLAGATIAYRYEGSVKELIAQMKYQNRRSVARYFASKLPTEPARQDYIICYVPADGPARRRRGYDQAEILARAYAKQVGAKAQSLLYRKQHSAQVGKGRTNRFESVQGNFLSRTRIDGKEVVLIDDVITTGATTSECAKVLKAAGAKSVWALAIAKG